MTVIFVRAKSKSISKSSKTFLRLETLTEKNFDEFSSFLNCEDSGCYCSFWHQKLSSMEEWDKRKAEEPEKNKACMLDKVRSRFHLGVLVYRGDNLVAWVSVGPLPEFYWAWRRVSKIGELAKLTAGIVCITRKSEVRNSLPEFEILNALKHYGKQQGWIAIEGYPFDREAINKHGESVTWAGFPEDFIHADFQKCDSNWLNSIDYPRSIFRVEL